MTNGLLTRSGRPAAPPPEEGERVKVYICAPPEDSRLFVSLLPPGNPHKVEVVSFGDDASILEQDIGQLGVSVVVLSPLVRNYSDRLVARLARWPELLVVVGLVPPTGDWARQVTAAGAVDVLRTPVTEQTVDMLVSSVPVWLQKAAKLRMEPGWIAGVPPDVAQAVQAMGYRQGIWPFWGPKGGVGKTTLACNVAVILGVIAQRRTLLADGNMNGGHVDLHMGIEPELTLASLAHQYRAAGNQLSPQMLKECAALWRADGSLYVLPGIQRVEQAVEEPLRGEQGGQFMRDLLETASRMFDFVVVDIGSSPNNPVHLAALTSADGVIVITTPDRASVIDVRSTLDTMEEVLGVDRSRYTLVVNMWMEAAGLGRGEIVEFVGLPEAGLVPMETSGAMAYAANAGEPFVMANLGSGNPAIQAVVNALIHIVGQVYPPIEAIWESRKGQRGRRSPVGLLGRLLGG